MKHARFVLLIVLAVGLLMSFDFAMTLFCAWMTSYTFVGPVSALVVSGGNPSALFIAFLITGGITLAVAIASIVLCCVDLYRKK